ncbi:unnamed protein product [Gongylonema pulchrum]|uniref:PAZ domain-containing protein n=1 Tax=Gongylonema pulchrum TaxID=637853 RepID=A0A183CXP2_9BILA|nr:unnamed protein product [Gongylonema pulchrum]
MQDDLESWIYMSVELFHSDILPWKKIVDREAVLTHKDNFFLLPSSEVYGKAPQGYKSISRYIDNLSFEEEPNYTLIQEIIRNENIDVSLPYDWFGYDLTKRKRRKRALDASDEAGRQSRNAPASPDVVRFKTFYNRVYCKITV